jgi:hypothetical protein
MAKEEPQPVLLNSSDSGHVPMTFRLYDGQSVDVSFLRVFISSKYADLSIISQASPMEAYTPKEEHGERMAFRTTPLSTPVEFGFWTVFTLPLVQRVHWDE